jgi:cell division protein FtsN
MSEVLKEGRGKIVETEGEPRSESGTITPGQMPKPPVPIVFPSQYARTADDEERFRRYDEFMEYATIEEKMAFQRAMIKQGLMDEPPEDQDEYDVQEAPWPQAVSQTQVYWARNQLRKAKNGASVPQPIAELEAMANTPLAGLPERVGQKKPVAKKPASKAKATTKKAKEA